MGLKVFLYRYEEYFPYNVYAKCKVKDGLDIFDSEFRKNKYPFRDRDSLEFLQKTFDIHFVNDTDRYALNAWNRVFPVTNLTKDWNLLGKVKPLVVTRKKFCKKSYL